MTRGSLVVLILAATLTRPLSGRQVRHARLVARVDSIAHRALAEGPVPGISIAVGRGKEILLAKGYGYARLADSTPATAETIYPIASITKQFTAAAIMQLAQAGRFKVKDELSTYLPAFPVQGKRVTIQQLLNHTSGIPDATGPDSSTQHHSALEFTPAEFLDAFAGKPFEFPPGENIAYSNSGYYLLGLVIEKVTGETFADYVTHHLILPEGMSASGYCGPAQADQALGYDVMNGTPSPAKPIDPERLFAAAGLCSSAVDLIKWQRALANGKIVNRFSWKQMMEPAELKDGSMASYGYGMTLGRLGKHRSVGHGGSIQGFASQLTFYPDDDLTVVVLANSERALPRRIADRIAGMVLGVVEPKIKDLPLTPAEMERYVGMYDLAAYSLEISVASGGLMMRIGGADGIKLLYQGAHEFVSEADPTTKVYFRVSQGRAKSLDFSAGELVLNATRRPTP